MDSIITSEIKISKRRIIGAAFFGLILGVFLDNAITFTIPNILAMIQKTDVEITRMNYESSTFPSLIVLPITSFFAAGIAAFIARKKGIFTGLLANSIFILVYAGLLIFAIVKGTDELVGDISFQLYMFIQFLSIFLASISGGFLGEKFYSPDKDLDLGNDKLTIFGIWWPHYFWILPFILYPFLTSFIIIIYVSILTLLVDFYFTIHPSLWLNIAWWIHFFIVPIMILLAIVVMFFGFIRFYGVIQYKQIESKGWRKFGQILLYGVGAQILSYALAYLGALITHNMSQPAAGDWKLGLIFLSIFPTFAILIYLFSWIKERAFHRY